MGTKGNIGALLTRIQQGSSPYLQAAYQFRLAELERKNRLADLLAEKRQTGIDEGTYIPAPKVQIGTTTDKLSLLPGMQDKTGLMPSYPSTIQPGATFRQGGEGYMPKPVRTKYEAGSFAEWQKEKEFESGLKIKESKSKPTKKETDYRSKEYKQDLQSAVEAIDNEADKDKVYRRLSAAYPQYSAEIMRVIYGKSKKEEEDIF